MFGHFSGEMAGKVMSAETEVPMSGLPDERLKTGKNSVVETLFGPSSPESERTAGDIRLPPQLQLPRTVGAWWAFEVRCPFCLWLIETFPTGVSSFLGPSLLQCRRCDRLLLSHRREWRERGAIAKAWYVVVSLIYVAGSIALMFVATYILCGLARGSLLWLQVSAAALWGMTVAGLQIARVSQSRWRQRGPAPQAHRPGIWSLDFFLSHKVFGGMLLSALAVAWLAARIGNL